MNVCGQRTERTCERETSHIQSSGGKLSRNALFGSDRGKKMFAALGNLRYELKTMIGVD